ncbi:MAG: uncharacterized protein H6Q70_3151 [Firmicutes bacterium]|nr:uncharacterized protein [Bacillota bacterium]
MSDGRYTLIKGSFHIFYPDMPKNGPQPDGDTITFKPDNINLTDHLLKNRRDRIRITGNGMIKIRFESIDTLETHYPIPRKPLIVHQDLEFGYKARDFVLDKLGFTNVVFYDDNPNLVKSVSQPSMPGYIIANGTDKYGRVIAFVYSGESTQEDGAKIYLKEAELKESINYQSFKNSLAYPALYTTLPIDLVDIFRLETDELRKNKLNIWAKDAISKEKSCIIKSLEQLKDLVIWPKLFRRLAAYFSENYKDLNSFILWLKDDSENRDDDITLPNREKAKLHDMFIVQDGAINFKYLPEEVILHDKKA